MKYDEIWELDITRYQDDEIWSMMKYENHIQPDIKMMKYDKYTSTQRHKYTSTLVHKSSCIKIQEYKSKKV